MRKYLIAIILLTAVSIANGENTAKNNSHTRDMSGSSNSKHVLNCVVTSGYHVYEFEQVCPVGGEKFMALRLGTHSTYGRSLDWEPLSYMRFPIPLPVCPSNGLVMAKEEYNEEELKRLSQVIASTAYRDLYSQHHATYYLYAKTIELQGEKTDNLWWLYLQSTWEASLCKNSDRYKEYALATISAGSERIAELEASSEKYWLLKIVVANMYRRIGDFESAQTLIDKFGNPSLADKKTNEYFMLAINLIKDAVKQKNIDRIAIKEDES